MVPSFIGLHGNFFMKFTKWLKTFSSSSFLQLFRIRKNRLQAAPALAMAKVKLYGSQARDTKFMKAISFWYKDIRLSRRWWYFFQIFSVYGCIMNHSIHIICILLETPICYPPQIYETKFLSLDCFSPSNPEILDSATLWGVQRGPWNTSGDWCHLGWDSAFGSGKRHTIQRWWMCWHMGVTPKIGVHPWNLA